MVILVMLALEVRVLGQLLDEPAVLLLQVVRELLFIQVDW